MEQVATIFDLSHEKWASNLSDRQRNILVGRIRDRISQAPREVAELMPPGVPVPPRPSHMDASAVEEFLLQRNKVVPADASP